MKASNTMAAALLALAASTTAQAYTLGGYPNELVNRDGRAYINLGIEDIQGSRPACHTNENWAFVIDTTANTYLRDLADWAVAENAAVYLVGSNSCVGGVETLKAIEVLNMK